ncbi:MAG: hypothetical protein K8S16_03925 [Bacteroidales bacterium]|nr:hypothetical protein [Bacteroidales bacterium]
MVINSCSKQEAVEQINDQKQEVKMSDEDITFCNKLVEFKKKVEYITETPGFKSGEIMSVDSAIWYLETLFNATYGFPYEQYTNTKTDETVLQIDINANGEVSLDDVVAMYDEIVNIVTQYYYNSGFNEKGFLLLDLEQGEINGNQLEIGLRSVTGEKGEGWEPFGPDDDWLYGNFLGRCDYTQDTTDAAEEIQKALNNHKPLVYPPPGYHFVYEIDELITLFGDEYTDESGDYLIFYIDNENGNFTWDEECLQPDEMNFHFNGEETVIYDILEPELGKRFMVCDLEGLQDTDEDENPRIRHNNILTFGIPHLIDPGIGIVKDQLDD